MIDRDELITPHFRWRELIRDDAPDPSADVLDNLHRLCARLEDVRRQLGGRAIHVNSGYRTPDHNKAVGGVANSQHLYGRAADIVVMGIPPRKVQSILDGSWDGGMGSYPTFTHLDTANNRRWRG